MKSFRDIIDNWKNPEPDPKKIFAQSFVDTVESAVIRSRSAELTEAKQHIYEDLPFMHGSNGLLANRREVFALLADIPDLDKELARLGSPEMLPTDVWRDYKPQDERFNEWLIEHGKPVTLLSETQRKKILDYYYLEHFADVICSHLISEHTQNDGSYYGATKPKVASDIDDQPAVSALSSESTVAEGGLQFKMFKRYLMKLCDNESLAHARVAHFVEEANQIIGSVDFFAIRDQVANGLADRWIRDGGAVAENIRNVLSKSLPKSSNDKVDSDGYLHDLVSYTIAPTKQAESNLNVSRTAIGKVAGTMKTTLFERWAKKEIFNDLKGKCHERY